MKSQEAVERKPLCNTILSSPTNSEIPGGQGGEKAFTLYCHPQEESTREILCTVKAATLLKHPLPKKAGQSPAGNRDQSKYSKPRSWFQNRLLVLLPVCNCLVSVTVSRTGLQNMHSSLHWTTKNTAQPTADTSLSSKSLLFFLLSPPPPPPPPPLFNC